ncbi:MAG: AMIN domain-containing protein, partial [Curvibacter sp.]
MTNGNKQIGIRMLKKIGLVFSLLLGQAVFAQGAIESVTGSMQGGNEVVRIDLSQALTALPTGFAIQSPARIALDFPGVANAMGRSTVEINQGNLKSVSVVQAGERTRVVLNLKQAASYKAEIQGKSLLVSLDASEVASAKPVNA